jgi:acyl-CoA reductase-like NAD-dependent aldehyde dehydrogenase
MKMCLGGVWVEGTAKTPVRSPYDGEVLDTVPRAGPEDVERALSAAVRGAKQMAALPAHERYAILRRTAGKLEAQAETFARRITQEEGKPIFEARAEVARAVQTLTLSAEEAKRIHGETIPLDAAPGWKGEFGFTLRLPCGVVAAISPFNFPLNLVCHKVGPALAAGNAVIIKPPSATPLSALALTEVLLECGLPPEALSCITGPGEQVGEALCRDGRVRMISFTGSRAVGERIAHVAGIKKVALELGGNSPIVALPDADLERVAAAVAATGYSNAGQVCISTQRVIAHRRVYEELLAAAKPKVEALRLGDPLDEATRVGPLIHEREAQRVEEWIEEARRGGARLVTGGSRQGALYAPTILADVQPTMRVAREELFGPAVVFAPYEKIEEALALANGSPYGLSASVFTHDLDTALRFARELDSGSIHVNWGPQWRADLMPYGGLKESGLGKEGPRYAVEEMTELKMVCVHPGG